MTVFTIGYEGLDVQSFVSLLRQHGVRTLVDIRELPLSRKPGFSKRALAAVLADAGIDYIHMVSLGCPKSVRDRYRQDGSWQRYTKGFMEHLDQQANAVKELATTAAESDCALLCFEADHQRCHRSFVAEAVHRYSGAAVRHIKATDMAKKALPVRSLRAVA